MKILEKNKDNKNILKNISGAFIIKGAAVILSMLTVPAYMSYFSDQSVLGVWYTILSLINWVNMFDFGIGNGLRNKLVNVYYSGDKENTSKYIVSAYVSVTVLCIFASIVLVIVLRIINWNTVFNIDESALSNDVLTKSMQIIFIGFMIQFVLRLVQSILYALQMSAVTNFIAFASNLLIYIFVIVAPKGTVEENMMQLSIAHVFLYNIPLIIATIYVFLVKFKGYKFRIVDFEFSKAKEILSVGVVLMWLQICWLGLSGTHSFLITRLVSPDAVVEYQIYYKIYNTIASLCVLAVSPIWSAITKAQTERNYVWIRKLNNLLLICTLVTFIADLLTFPFLQFAVDLWLGSESISISIECAFIMTIFNSLFVLHNVNTSVANGLSNFRTQNIWMTVALVLMIPLSILFCNILDSWTGVMLGCSVAILPYEIIQPIVTRKYLNKKVSETDSCDGLENKETVS